MAKKILLDTNFIFYEKLKKLSLADAQIFILLFLNPWVSKAGIYQFNSEPLFKLLGHEKFLTPEQIQKIDAETVDDLGSPMTDAQKIEKKIYVAGLVIKKKIPLFIESGALQYDPDGHYIYFPDYHDFVPIDGSPLVVARELLASIKAANCHRFYNVYWDKHQKSYEEFFQKSLDKKPDSKASEKYQSELQKNYLEIKKFFFKNS